MNQLCYLVLFVCLLNIDSPLAYGEPPLAYEVQSPNAKLRKRYIGKETSVYVAFYDRLMKKTIWRVEKGGSTHGHVLCLKIGPSAHYAVASHEYGTKGESLYWVDLKKGSNESGIEIEMDALRQLVADTLKIPGEWLNELYFIPKKWLSKNTCIFVWKCVAPGDDGVNDAGVIFVSFDPRTSKIPTLKMGRYIVGMSDDQELALAEKDFSPLFKNGRQTP